MDTLPWCQLRMELEQPAFPQLLPRAGLPWGEVLALSLDILRVYLEPSPSHHLIPVLVQSVRVQVSFPSLFGYSCMSCSGAFPSSPLPIHAEGQSWQLWLGGQEELLSSHDLGF